MEGDRVLIYLISWLMNMNVEIELKFGMEFLES